MEHKPLKTLVRMGLVFLTGVQLDSSVAQQKPPDAQHFSILGVKIGQDSSESLVSKLGRVKMCRAEGHISIAGYSNSKEALIFEFSEVGGGDITGFYLHRTTGSSHRGCTLLPLPVGISDLTTEGGIHLGMSEKEFMEAFGSPRHRSQGGEWKYQWAWKAKLTDKEREAVARSTPGSTPPEEADISVWVEGRFARGSLSYFHISKLETL